MKRYRYSVLIPSGIVALGICTLFIPTAVSQAQNGPAAAPSSGVPPDALLAAQKLYRTGHLDEAIAKYQAVLQQNPKLGEAYADLSRCLLKQQKVDEAFQAASKGVSETPDSAAAHSALGEVLFRKGDMHESDVEFVKAANSNQPDARAFLGIARIENSMSLYGKAKKSIERAH